MLVLTLFLFGILAPIQTDAADSFISLNIPDLSGAGNSSSKILNAILLITVLSIAPSILVMATSFTRIVIVLSLVRQAMGAQQTPPNSVLVGLALFLTVFIMTPTMDKSFKYGIEPLINGKITEEEALKNISEPFREFMIAQTRKDDLNRFVEATETRIGEDENIPFNVLVPSFLISELRRAFEIGFLVFLPFLIIDLIVASTLMTVGIMMLPPVVISLPFKIVFFVLIDGWSMISANLVKSFNPI